MAGKTGYTPVTNASAMLGPAQITGVYEHFDEIIDQSVSGSGLLPATGNWTGRRVIVSADDSEWRWDGATWKLMSQPWATYSPTVSGLNTGTGGSLIGLKAVAAGIQQAIITYTLGTSGFSVGDLSVPLPTTAPSWMNDLTVLGEATLIDSSAGAAGRYRAPIVLAGTRTLGRILISGTNGNLSPVSSTAPFTWAAGDQIIVNMRCPQA